MMRLDVGAALTAAMRADRRADLRRKFWQYPALAAWGMWGWNVNGRGGIGYPGMDWTGCRRRRR